MSENTRRHNYLNLIVGLAFLSYGFYRLFTFWNGVPYTTFRIIIAIGFIIMGGWDLYRFFNPSEEE
ncbi:hypothetical protein GCM10010465_23930 [Actinomadura fibrosa]